MLHDCGIGSIDGAADLDSLRGALDDETPVRYRGMLVSSEYDAWSRLGLTPGFGDDRFRVHGIKAWSDGSNQAGTGFQREPHLGTDSCGSLNYSPDELAEVVLRAHRDGWQVGVHANGDAAIDVTVDAFERALVTAPRDDHRHRIEHCSVMHPEQIERMATLGLSPSFLIGHLRWWGINFRDRLLGPERSPLYDPARLGPAGRAAYLVAQRLERDPVGAAALPRGCRDADHSRERRGAQRRRMHQVEAALRAVTIDAAWQCRADDVTGLIEVGKYADLVLLDKNPATVDPSRISRIAVSEPRLAGQARYSR
ncbi:MAG: amidohydrolase family protein [Terracoccus sp.]